MSRVYPPDLQAALQLRQLMFEPIDLAEIDEWIDATDPPPWGDGQREAVIEWRERLVSSLLRGDDEAATGWGLFLTTLVAFNQREAFLHPKALQGQKLAPFAEHNGRGEGPIKKLVREVLPGLEKRLKRKAKALEVWHACAAKRRPGIKFASSATWGEPQQVTAAGEPATTWERFRVIISEVRRKPVTRDQPPA